MKGFEKNKYTHFSGGRAQQRAKRVRTHARAAEGPEKQPHETAISAILRYGCV
jgi:hypothetical protein